MSLQAVSIEVRGKVQGVWYRASSKVEADRLGLYGFVKNKEDGSVYLEVFGESSHVEQFICWSLRGPELAQVTEFKINQIDLFSADKFEIIR